MEKKLILFCLCLIAINGYAKLCDTVRVEIKGNIKNLPDGRIYLYKTTADTVIDSTLVKNGKFYFNHTFKENSPQYVGFYHYDKDRIKTLFFFPKKKLASGETGFIDRILSDSAISLTDSLIIDKTVSKENLLFSNTKVHGGPQTDAFLDSEIDLFEKIDSEKIKVIRNKISRYPYSYHLLYEINDNRNTIQLKDLEIFMTLFNVQLKSDKVYQDIADFISLKKKAQEHQIITSLKDSKGKNQKILDRKYKKHMIIFWASWCGPCLREIPALKKIHKVNENVELISISLDENLQSWKKKLEKEKMDWKQLIASPEDKKLLEASLGLSDTIPYTVIVDHNFKIIHKVTGLISESEIKSILED